MRRIRRIEPVRAGGAVCGYMCDVRYKGRHVAAQRLDMVIDHRVIVENKAAEKLSWANADLLTIQFVPLRPIRAQQFAL